MSDHFNQFLDASLYALPWLAFLSGLAGSLHCVGMCGGLVSACAPKKQDVFLYQIGRLLGYSLLGVFAGTLGHLISSQLRDSFLEVVPALTLGLLFFYWGYNSYRNKKEIKTPKILNLGYKKVWKLIMPSIDSGLKPFAVGFFSILLPCGLLYALVIVAAAFQSPLKALIAMFFFWLGTVPAMTMAPSLFNKFLSKIAGKSPKVLGLSFMLLGILTIGYRVLLIYGQQSGGANCH